jgi:hypothetical protein
VPAGFAGTKKPVGASLLAIAVCQSTVLLLVYRYREQARSHMGYFPQGLFLPGAYQVTPNPAV